MARRVFWALLRPKCTCGQSSVRNPAGVAYSAPADSLAGWEGLTAHPQEPLHVLGLQPRISALRASGVLHPSHILGYAYACSGAVQCLHK